MTEVLIICTSRYPNQLVMAMAVMLSAWRHISKLTLSSVCRGGIREKKYLIPFILKFRKDRCNQN